MAEARTPQKSLPKINKVDQRFWDGAAAGKLLLQNARVAARCNSFRVSPAWIVSASLIGSSRRAAEKYTLSRWYVCRAIRLSKKRRRFIYQRDFG
jgi:hypothetical protein